MPDSWWKVRLTSILAMFQSLFRKRISLAHDSDRAANFVLWRVAFVLISAVILGQLFLPRSLTAQSPADAGDNTSSNTRSRTGTVQRPQGIPGPGSNPKQRKVNQFSPIKANQPPRPIADRDREIEERPRVRSGRPNHVAPAEFQQDAAETDEQAEPKSGESPLSVNQLVNTDQMLSPQGLKSSLGVGLAVTVLSLAPAILMMSTCFVRFIVVLSLLRQALGTPNLPPNQVLMGLSLCLTFLVMSPVWNESYQQGIRPYAEATSAASRPNLAEVFDKTVAPIRRFMSHQIEKANNADAVWMFVEYQRPAQGSPAAETWLEPETYDDVSLTVLLPAYLLSELKTAFLIGFQIYLPFLIIDLVVASVLMSMGLSMLSPTQVSLPFKLLLFVLIDGWTLTVGMLIESVRLAT